MEERRETMSVEGRKCQCRTRGHLPRGGDETLRCFVPSWTLTELLVCDGEGTSMDLEDREQRSRKAEMSL